MEPIIRKKTDLHELQKIMARNGELCNEAMTATHFENKLGQKLIDEGIGIYPDFKVEEKSFDFKIAHTNILVEIDGVIHNDQDIRLKDYKKDRMAQKKGFRVLRFSNDEINQNLVNCVEEIKSMINKCGRVPREIWLYQYTVFDWIKDKFKGRKLPKRTGQYDY